MISQLTSLKIVSHSEETVRCVLDLEPTSSWLDADLLTGLSSTRTLVHHMLQACYRTLGLVIDLMNMRLN